MTDCFEVTYRQLLSEVAIRALDLGWLEVQLSRSTVSYDAGRRGIHPISSPVASPVFKSLCSCAITR